MAKSGAGPDDAIDTSRVAGRDHVYVLMMPGWEQPVEVPRSHVDDALVKWDEVSAPATPPPPLAGVRLSAMKSATTHLF